MPRVRSLRNAFTQLSGALAGATLVLAVTLALSAYRSAAVSREFYGAVFSIRAAEEVEVGLLFTSLEYRLYFETRQPRHAEAVRRAQAQLRAWLETSAASIDTDEERAALDSLRESVRALEGMLVFDTPVTIAEWEPAFDRAFADAEALIRLNERYAQQTLDQAEARRRAVLYIAGVGMAMAIAGLVVALVFTRRAVYRPVQRLRAALAQRASDPEARVPEEGPRELREIGSDVNELVDSLAAQRAHQLTFLSSIAHDLRNPMTSLRAAAQLAVRQEDAPPEKQRERARLMLRQVDRMNRLVEDLLDVSRIEAGRFELRKERRDLREVVRDTVQLYEETSPSHEIRASLPDEPVNVEHDPGRIAQVLGNLVGNAIKYSPAGGPVDVRLRAENGEAVVEVEDRGLGIPENERESIFEPFRRSGGERAAIPGVGLGLSVARRLVRAHGGEIEVESEEGAGSTFRVRLPLARP